MAVDLNKIKQKRQEVEAKAAARAMGRPRFWSPKSGANRIRILPPWTAEGYNCNNFAREIYQHWLEIEGKRIPFTCPTKTPDLGGPCALCDEVNRLRATNDPSDAETATEIRASQGYMSNVVDLDDPVFTQKDYDTVVASGDEPKFEVGDTKVQVFQYGSMIHKQLMDNFVLLNTDLTDAVNGREVIINKTGKGRTGTKYNTIVGAPGPLVWEGADPVEKRLYNLDSLSAPREDADVRQAIGGISGSPVSLPAPRKAASLPPKATRTADYDGDDVARQMREALEGK